MQKATFRKETDFRNKNWIYDNLDMYKKIRKFTKATKIYKHFKRIQKHSYK